MRNRVIEELDQPPTTQRKFMSNENLATQQLSVDEYKEDITEKIKGMSRNMSPVIQTEIYSEG